MPADILEPTRGANVGRVVVRVNVENYADVERAEAGEVPAEAVRRIAVDALVDSGATYFCLPKSLIDRLGLRFRKPTEARVPRAPWVPWAPWVPCRSSSAGMAGVGMTKEARTVAGPLELGVYAAARIEVQGRDCVSEVMELPEGRQCLFGQIPLELMDWWIDATNQRLVGNPEHGGQWMAEAF